MRRCLIFPAFCLSLCLCAGCNLDRGRAVPPQARDPFANRIDPENPPPPDSETKPQNATVQMPSPLQLGIQFYPNAEPYKDEFGVGAAQIQAEGIVTAILETTDSSDKVVAYYKKAMPQAEQSREMEDNKPVTRFSEPYGGNGIHMVEVSEVNGKTRITLQNLKPTKSADALLQPPAEVNTSAPGAGASIPASGGALPRIDVGQ